MKMQSATLLTPSTAEQLRFHQPPRIYQVAAHSALTGQSDWDPQVQRSPQTSGGIRLRLDLITQRPVAETSKCKGGSRVFLFCYEIFVRTQRRNSFKSGKTEVSIKTIVTILNCFNLSSHRLPEKFSLSVLAEFMFGVGQGGIQTMGKQCYHGSYQAFVHN